MSLLTRSSKDGQRARWSTRSSNLTNTVHTPDLRDLHIYNAGILDFSLHQESSTGHDRTRTVETPLYEPKVVCPEVIKSRYRYFFAVLLPSCTVSYNLSVLM